MTYLGTKPANQIIDSSLLGDGSVTLTKLASDAKFASGTSILFQQSVAPTGWTKVTAYNDYALRVISGSVSTGGSVPFSTAFNASNSVDGTAITTAQMPAHNHSINDPGHSHSINDPGHYHYVWNGDTTGGGISGTQYSCYYSGAGYYAYNIGGDGTLPDRGITRASTTGISINGSTTGITTNNNGSGGAHNHTLSNLAVKYVDVIICTKD